MSQPIQVYDMQRCYSGLSLALICLLAAWSEAASPAMWTAKAPATSFVADWSHADQRDAEASAYFLTQIWPAVRNAAKELEEKGDRPTNEPYSGPLTPQEQAAGLVSFLLPPEQTLPWYAVPTAQQTRQRTISVFAAQGQSKAICVGVHALKPVKEVTVVPTELVGPGVIPASAITTRLSLSYTINPRQKDTITARQMLLLKVEQWDIPQAQTSEWVIDVHVPVDVSAGVYSGKIAVMTGKTTVSEFDLELEVLPFRLTDNGCRWGSFMTPNPAYTTDAWCDVNARYEMNSLAWWYLEDPHLRWTWENYQQEAVILAKLRNQEGHSFKGKELTVLKKQLPGWLQTRFEGAFLRFTPEEIEGYWDKGSVVPLPEDLSPQGPAYKRPLQLKQELGELSDAHASLICFDRPGILPNFREQSLHTVAFQQDAAFRQFDEGMQRLKRYGFVGPITWFSAGKTPMAWETKVISHRFGQLYSRQNWTWQPAVTPQNSNHLWYLANAAVAKTFSEAVDTHGWPEVVWCPRDESLDAYGVSGRAAANMIGEMLPYIRQYAPNSRIYSVVWQTKEDNWKGLWQCGVYQKFAQKKNSQGELVPSSKYGPFHVISTNCPNDLDRETTWEAGGEYWLYTLLTSTVKSFLDNRFAFGFWGARHYGAVMYNYADGSGPQNVNPARDVKDSVWLTGREHGLETLNFYLSKEPQGKKIDYALASHAMLACREGIHDRKYVETLRTLAYERASEDDIDFLRTLPDRIASTERSRFSFEELRREIAFRIKALVSP